ncbi:hypothetical protein GYMLUDRAFT_50450 [Collybiopsis luxurians FD-317 M1]|uniref:Uncharacterized protein n=1 Tax=Collybiopsis luxurians FD-317 M1 TaxID=944289 RepID=A0A0D0BB96_9AGAR|nr:hypothetical protein GYMLUDRAFT_50450 [Collybiopsis luxurians FD-317 M1]
MLELGRSSSDPQHFEVVVQISYNASGFKARSLSTTGDSWHQQCRKDLSAIKLPWPPENSLTCSVSGSKVQMAWNVHARDHIVDTFSLVFNPTDSTLKETREKLDVLDIYQIHMIKRWINSSGSQSLTLAGLLRSSKASRDYLETTGYQPNASSPACPSLLIQDIPVQAGPSKLSLDIGKPSLNPPPASSTSSFNPGTLPQRAPLPAFPRDILLPSTPVPPGSILPSVPAFPLSPETGSQTGNQHKDAASSRELTSNSPTLPHQLSNYPRMRKRTISSGTDAHSTAMVSPSIKRPKPQGDRSSQTYDDLQRKFIDVKAQLAQEKKARTTAETHLYRLQQQYVGSGLNASHLDLLQAVVAAQGDAETHKAKSDELQQELVSLKAELEANDLLVSRLRQEAELERKEAENLRFKLERLREENTSLIHNVNDYDHDRGFIRSNNRAVDETCTVDIHALRLQAERHRLQLDEYKSRLQRAESSQAEEGASRAQDLWLKRPALSGRRSELERVRAELERERGLRLELEGVVDDMKRECRTPYVVPALVDALGEISKLSTRVRSYAEDLEQTDFPPEARGEKARLRPRTG